MQRRTTVRRHSSSPLCHGPERFRSPGLSAAEGPGAVAPSVATAGGRGAFQSRLPARFCGLRDSWGGVAPSAAARPGCALASTLPCGDSGVVTSVSHPTPLGMCRPRGRHMPSGVGCDTLVTTPLSPHGRVLARAHPGLAAAEGATPPQESLRPQNRAGRRLWKAPRPPAVATDGATAPGPSAALRPGDRNLSGP